jgi:D-cysteine desulfhydrase
MKTQELLRRLGALEPLPLGHAPTPLAPLERLSASLGGPEVWVKRDDLTGLGMGGNKVRKLRYLLAEALRQKADVVVTTGARQSNHARQTAAAAAALGLPCVLVLGGDQPRTPPQGNHLLDNLFGAGIRWAGNEPLPDALHAEAEALRARGRRPYVAPYGGSSPTGVCGFVEAMAELLEQAAKGDITFDAVVVASSSGGTQTGLTLGARALDYGGRVVGISIAEPAVPFRRGMAELAARTAELLHLDVTLQAEDFEVRDDFLGGGYGVVGELEREAIRALASAEGLLVDPVYTGRALGGLLALVRRGEFPPGERVLFWHTGGTPALFAYGKELTR